MLATFSTARTHYHPTRKTRQSALNLPALNQENIAQIGGATGLVGDPSGRKTEREPANVAQVEKNVELLSDSIRTFFHRGLLYAKSRSPPMSGSTSDPEVRSNLEWHRDFTMLDFLRVVGVHSRVNTMLSKER